MHPLSLLQHERRVQRKLCDDLEKIANQLREGVDQSLWQSTRDCLQSGLPIFHRHEEILFSLLERDHPQSSILGPGVRLAVKEHLINETYAFDLDEWLDDACSGVRPRNTEAAAYSLRCSFDGMRRHMNWEDAILLPAVTTVITPGNMAFLAEQLARSERKTPPFH